MDSREFRSQTREILEHTLNQLHAATLLVAELESQVSEAGRAVQGLTQIIEQYVASAETEQPAIEPPEADGLNLDEMASD